MSLAQILEEALRQQGVNATVTDASEPVPEPDSRVVVKNTINSTYTMGDVEVEIVSAIEGKVENVRVTHGGFIALDVEGDCAQNFLGAMQQVMADMRKVG